MRKKTNGRVSDRTNFFCMSIQKPYLRSPPSRGRRHFKARCRTHSTCRRWNTASSSRSTTSRQALAPSCTKTISQSNVLSQTIEMAWVKGNGLPVKLFNESGSPKLTARSKTGKQLFKSERQNLPNFQGRMRNRWVFITKTSQTWVLTCKSRGHPWSKPCSPPLVSRTNTS